MFLRSLIKMQSLLLKKPRSYCVCMWRGEEDGEEEKSMWKNEKEWPGMS